VFKQEQLGVLVVVFEGLPLQDPQGLTVQHLPGHGLELEDLGADRLGLMLLPLQFQPACFLAPLLQARAVARPMPLLALLVFPAGVLPGAFIPASRRGRPDKAAPPSASGPAPRTGAGRD